MADPIFSVMLNVDPSTVAVESGSGSPLWLAAPRPCPTAGPVALSFTLPRAGRVSLAIHDLAGRRVNRLVSAPLGAGPHELSWNGKLESGAPALRGVYLVRLDFEGSSAARRIVRLR